MDTEYKYAVITTFSFDNYRPVKLFKTLEEAQKYLEEIYEQELFIDEKENKFSVSSFYDKEEGRAVITTHYSCGDETTTFFIGDITI